MYLPDLAAVLLSRRHGATSFLVIAPANVTGGAAFAFTVTAKDANSNTVTGYTGTVGFTSTDGAATLPANTTISAGVGVLTATLVTSGSQTLTATDATTSSITGHSGTITVSSTAVNLFGIGVTPISSAPI